jgi:hypothetical protein
MEKQTPAELGETVIDYWQDRLEAEGLRLDVIGVGIDELGEHRLSRGPLKPGAKRPT